MNQTTNDYARLLRRCAFNQKDLSVARGLERAAKRLEELEGKYTALKAYLELEQEKSRAASRLSSRQTSDSADTGACTDDE